MLSVHVNVTQLSCDTSHTTLVLFCSELRRNFVDTHPRALFPKGDLFMDGNVLA